MGGPDQKSERNGGVFSLKTLEVVGVLVVHQYQKQPQTRASSNNDGQITFWKFNLSSKLEARHH